MWGKSKSEYPKNLKQRNSKLRFMSDLFLNDFPPVIHVRTRQRNLSKQLTHIEGLPPTINFKNFLKDIRSQLCCGGSLKKNALTGNTIVELQGDHKRGVMKFIIENDITDRKNIRIH